MGRQSRKKHEQREQAARRPVQAPKRRQPTTAGWSGRQKALLSAGVLAAALAVALAVAFTRGGGSTDASKAFAAAGCTLKSYPSQGRSHVSSLSAKIDYNSFPPTSGSHYSQPAIWNSYDGPLVLVQEVHNLEHGGIVVQYGNKVPASTVEQLQGFYSESPNALLLAPLPKLDDKIALSAWTHLGMCTRYNAAAFRAFRDAYRGKGPERFPVSSLTPGS